MVILDLTKFTGERPKIWPVDMPDKIRLIEGKHDYGYDVHPMCRNTMWYKKLVKMALEEEPNKRANIPDTRNME